MTIRGIPGSSSHKNSQMNNMNISADNLLQIDLEAEINKICVAIRTTLRDKLKKRGLVVAVSGGIDSSVSAALCVKALGKGKVFALLLPEADSSTDSQSLGEKLVQHLDIPYETVNITPTLEAIGCYKWRDEAIRKIFPDYDGTWKNKIIISGGQEGKFNHFKLVVQKPGGDILEERMNLNEYLQIVAATSYKQRIRKTIEYFHADRLNYAVVGTPNRLEYDQGFFVKNGDGSADIKPIAHLYKTQVYELAGCLNLPAEICNSVPTTDTYSMSQGQDEFYFALPYKQMDVALWCINNNKTSSDLADILHISQQKAEYVYADIKNKRKTTAHLHWPAITVEQIAGPFQCYEDY